MATLIYHCGVSVDMDYGYNESSANNILVADAFINYFTYHSSARLIGYDNIHYDQWINVIKRELDASRPVFYGFLNDNLAHSLVCDGYKYDGYDNVFHFNFGWSGSWDGYYYLGAPDNTEFAVIGIQPPWNEIAEIENEAYNFSIKVLQNHIMLEGINGERVYVSDVLGRVVYNAIVNEKAEIAVRNRGVFFVKVGNRPAQKVVVIQ